MDTNQQIDILIYIFVGIATIITILGFILIGMWLKNRSNKYRKTVTVQNENSNKGKNSSIERQSVFNFMEFDTVDDNMIIQNNGTRFLMVIECQGVNYDLMSGVEKAGVEEGFVQFLNTLRSPIQIYIQTRSVNLENSILTYKDKLRKIEDKLNRMKNQYYELIDSGDYSQEQADKMFYEVTKQSNLYEYGRDVINNTERMSLNKNILNQKYYIILPFYAAELGSNDLDKEETKNLAFSEIYTRAQTLIRSISSCGVKGKILKTNELIELLYMAYNRDEAEIFGLDRAIKAGYDEINSTAPDVLDKKMRELNKYIEEKAMEKARNSVDQVMSEKAQKVAQKEDNMQELIRQMAQAIIKENEKYVGKEVTQEAIAKIASEISTKEKKGGKSDAKKETKTRKSNTRE